MDFEAVSKMVLWTIQQGPCPLLLLSAGLPCMLQGFPRATKDIDFLMHIDDLPKVKNILTGFELGYRP